MRRIHSVAAGGDKFRNRAVIPANSVDLQRARRAFNVQRINVFNTSESLTSYSHYG